MPRPEKPEAPGIGAHPPSKTESTAPVPEKAPEQPGLTAPSPSSAPTQDAEQEAKAYAQRVGQAMLQDLPEGVSAEPVEGRPRPTVKLTYLQALRGGETCIVGLAGNSEDVDASSALLAVKSFWGL